MRNEVHQTQICDRPLTTQSPKDLLRAYRHLSKPLRRAAETNTLGKVYYDVSNCPRMDSGALLLLSYSAYALKRLGWEAYVRGHGAPYEMVVENIQHMHQTPELRKTTTTTTGEFLCRKVPKHEQMVVELQEWAGTVGAQADAAEVALWQMQISEITTNSFQHGQLVEPHILVAGRAHRQQKIVQLAALDFGRGIPKSVAHVAKQAGIPAGDGNYIRHACCRGVTSRTVPQNQGAGLNSLVETVKERQGALIIFSGNRVFHVTKGRRYRRNFSASGSQAMIAGTLIVLNLKLL